MTTEQSAPEDTRAPSGILGYFEHIDTQRVRGWALSKEGQPLTLYLYISGALYPLETKWTHRADIQQTHGDQHALAGFECRLTSDLFDLVWRTAQKNEPFNIVANRTMLRNVAKLPLDSLYEIAKTLVAEKQWAEAESTLKQSLTGKPDDADAHWLLSIVLDKLGRTWEATDACGRAVELSEPSYERQFAYALYLERMNRFGPCLEALRVAASIEPENHEVHYRMGFMLEKLGQPQEAKLAYFYATELDPSGEGRKFGHGLYHAKRNYWPEAADAFVCSLEEQRSNAELWYRLGMAQDRCYRWADAAHAFAQAIALDPTNAQWHYRLGFVLERQSEWAASAGAYTSAVERKADHDGYWYYRLGYVLAQGGNYPEACAAFEQTRKHKALVPQVLSDKGLEFLKNRNEYLEYLELGSLKGTTLYHDLQNLGFGSPLFEQFLQDIEGLETNCASKVLKVWVLNEKETLPQGLDQFSNVLFVPQGSDLHLRYLARAENVRFSASNAPVITEAGHPSDLAQRHFNLGRLLEQCRRWTLAAKAYEEGLALDGTDANWHWRHGLALEQAGQWREAEQAYGRAIDRRDGHDPLWFYRRAYALSQAGDKQAACSAYRWSRILGRPVGVNTSGYTKDSSFKTVTEYTEYSECLPLRDNTILYESFHGVSMSCNPYAIFKELLHRPEFESWTHIWVVNEKSRVPEEHIGNPNLIVITKESEAYFRHLATAKYLINNSTFPPCFIRRQEQLYLNTWHGTPIKTLGKDIGSAFMEHKNTARNLLHATHIISPNEHTTHVLIARNEISSSVSALIAETGYPRVDATLNFTDLQKSELKKKLELDNDKKIVLYAPTFRGNLANKKIEADKVVSDLKLLSTLDCNILFRGHYFVEKELIALNLPVLNVPPTVDSNELLAITDILISDYSSIFFDFAATKRPIIHYVYDLDAYKIERGLYFGTEKMPGIVCNDILQTKFELKKLIQCDTFELTEKHQSVIKEFSPMDDGKATGRVIDLLFHNGPSSQARTTPKRKSILFFEGPFMPNGITTSFTNLIKNLDSSKYAPVVAIADNQIQGFSERMGQLEKITGKVELIARVGRINLTCEERWIIDQFDTNGQFSSEEAKTAYAKAFEREYKRIFGYSTFDAVVNFEGYSKFWASILLYGRPKETKAVMYQHNDMAGEWLTRFPHMEGLFRIYDAADELVGVSKPTTELNKSQLASTFGIMEKKFVSCINTIVPSEIIAAAQEPIEECDSLLFSETGVTRFVSMGRLSPEKDQAKLITAFAKLIESHPKIHLYVLGEGPLRYELQMLIDRLGLGSHVFLLGQRQNPFPYLRLSDCFVLSSNHEGQPMVLLEALTLGLPVIATDIVGSRSVLEPGYGELVPNDVHGLISGISEFLDGGLDFKAFDHAEYQIASMARFTSLLFGEPK